MIVEHSKPGRSQVFDARKLFKNSWTNSISNLFAMNSPSVKQIMAGCGLGKSTTLPTIILNEYPDLKIITVVPHLKAKANAKFVNEKWVIKANSIFGGDNISLALSQPPVVFYSYNGEDGFDNDCIGTPECIPFCKSCGFF